MPGGHPVKSMCEVHLRALRNQVHLYSSPLWVKATMDADTGGLAGVLNTHRPYLCPSSLDKAATPFPPCLHRVRDGKSLRGGLKDTEGCMQVLCRHCAIEHRDLSGQACLYPCVLEPVFPHPRLGLTGKSCSVVHTGYQLSSGLS